MKHLVRTYYILLLVFLGITLGSSAQQSISLEVNGYRIYRGERPVFSLASLPKSAYEKGKIKIKLRPDRENLIPQTGLTAGPAGYVITGNASLDALNKKYRVKSYRPLFGMLYDTRSQCDRYRDRHRVWGFHLWYELEIPQDANIVEVVNEFLHLESIDFAEPEYRKELVIHDSDFSLSEKVATSITSGNLRWIPDDPEFPDQWHYQNTGQQGGTPGADIRLPLAWEIEKGHPAVIVAVIDGGIDYNHADLSGNMWSGTGYNFVTNSPVIQPHNHGTHVAGTIAAVTNNNTGVSGIAGGSGSGNGVRLMSCQVFTSSSNGGFHLAPIYAADNGAAISQNSWNYTIPDVYDQAVLDAIDYFNTNGGGTVMNGGITIFSAGNYNSSANYYPASYSGTFAVAATNNQDIKSYYSNFGTWVDLSAPGGETNIVTQRGVLSTLVGNNYGYYQGTSMACPHVSGVAALMLSLGQGYLNPLLIKNILKESADNHYAVNPGYEGLLGSGRLNAHQALLMVELLMSSVPNPRNFIAIPQSDSSILLTWQKNIANHDVMVAFALNGIFGTPEEGQWYLPGQEITGGGTVLYTGSANEFIHLNLPPETTVYYKLFSVTPAASYSSGISTSATTLPELFVNFTATPAVQMQLMPVVFSDASIGYNFTSWHWHFGDGANPPTASGPGPHQVYYTSLGYKTVTLTINQIHSVTKTDVIQITPLIFSASNTYTAGDIPTDRGFVFLPGASACPGNLTVEIPLNTQITSVDVSYQMEAVGAGWKSEQRSHLRCVSPGGTQENLLYSGSGNTPGIQNYQRTGLTIANGVIGGGAVQFQLHAGRTWGGSGCNLVYNKVLNNTWNVKVNYTYNQNLLIDFISDKSQPCPGDTVHFLFTANIPPTSFQWNFPGGTPETSSSAQPSVVYQSPGNYDVSLTVWYNTASHTISKNHWIVVLSLPEKPVIPSGPVTLCQSDTSSEYVIDAVPRADLIEWNLHPANAGTLQSEDTLLRIIWNSSFYDTAYLKARGMNTCGYGDWSDELIISRKKCLPADLPTGWAYHFTEIIDSVMIPSTSTVRFYGNALTDGSWIGVFYENASGQMVCGGAVKYISGQELTLFLYGNSNPDSIKNGFFTGESLHWKIHEITSNQDYDAIARLNPSSPDPEGVFGNGYSVLDNLSALATFTTELQSGWQGFSVPMIPLTPDVPELFGSISNQLVMVWQFYQIYWPDMNINTFEEWQIHYGAALKLSAPAIFTTIGVPERVTLQLQQGWNFLPVIALCEVSVEDVVGEFLSAVDLIKEVSGNKVFWPVLGISTLDTLLPGNAYLIRLNQPVNLSFPDCPR